jgi:hypothetical protein
MPKHPDLTAYVLGELRSDAVESHIRACDHCQKELSLIQSVSARLQAPPIYAAPNGVWSRIGIRSAPSAAPQFALAAVAVIAIVSLLFVSRAHPAGEPLSVRTLSGAPMVDGRRIAASARIGTGEALETDASSSASVTLAGLGEVELLPGSRLRLLKSSAKTRRFALDTGSLRASVTAPPRLFVVDTPSASAVDLGCAYELSVLPAGGTRLHVTAGWVVLESKEGSAYLSSSMVCESDGFGRVQPPYYEDSPNEFKRALREYDGTGDALATVLSTTRPKDALTLWHLLSRSKGQNRVDVYEKLEQLAPPPTGVTKAGILALDSEMLRLWREDLDPSESVLQALMAAFRFDQTKKSD